MCAITEFGKWCIIIADFLLLPNAVSDDAHVPLMCALELSPSITVPMNSEPVLCFKKANYDLIREYLENINLSTLINQRSANINEIVSCLYEIIRDVFEKFVPKPTIRASTKPPRYNRELSHLKNIRNKEYKKLCNDRRMNANSDEGSFLGAKNEFEECRKKLHSEYIRNKAECLKSDPKQFWRFINTKRKSNELPASIEYGDKKATTDLEKAQFFAEYFQTVYVKHPDDSDLPNFIRERNDHGYFKMGFTADCIHSVLSQMDLSKGSGFDGVASIFLRECADMLSGPLCDIFNRSLHEGCYPDSFGS